MNIDQMESCTSLKFTVAGSDVEFAIQPKRLIVAGYTGRDEATVRHHIDELAAIGIAPPPTVPMLYELDPQLLTSKGAVQVGGDRTSGEVEPVYVRQDGKWFLTVGSDHTDRALERVDVGQSKAACPKPIASEVVALPEDVISGGYDRAWDGLHAKSSVDGKPYQEGTLATLRLPSVLLSRVVEHVDGGHDDGPDLVVFAGTLPLINGEFRFGQQWELRLDFGEITLRHAYTVESPAPMEATATTLTLKREEADG